MWTSRPTDIGDFGGLKIFIVPKVQGKDKIRFSSDQNPKNFVNFHWPQANTVMYITEEMCFTSESVTIN